MSDVLDLSECLVMSSGRGYYNCTIYVTNKPSVAIVSRSEAASLARYANGWHTCQKRRYGFIYAKKFEFINEWGTMHLPR